LHIHSSGCGKCSYSDQHYADKYSIARGFPSGPRWIGDKHSWVLPLNMAGVDVPTVVPKPSTGGPPPMSHDLCFVTSWELVHSSSGESKNAKEVRAMVCSNGHFRYSYVIGDPKLQKAMSMIRELHAYLPAAAGSERVERLCAFSCAQCIWQRMLTRMYVAVMRSWCGFVEPRSRKRRCGTSGTRSECLQ
jgi:hypothetical protein